MAFRLRLAFAALVVFAALPASAQNVDAALQRQAELERAAKILVPSTNSTFDADERTKALANGLRPITLEDPNALPYEPATGPVVLPPIRPSADELRARAERDRLAAERARRATEARREAAVRPAYAPQPRSAQLCNTNRCPHQNMIGIQY